MKTINLRDYYPWYTKDEFVEVSDEVAETMITAEREENNYMRRVFYNKAHYSLDAEDGIETAAIMYSNDNPEAIIEMVERHCGLCRALNSLPEIQGRRIEAHYILGKSIKEIAAAEGTGERNVRKAIYRGLAAMKIFLQAGDQI